MKIVAVFLSDETTTRRLTLAFRNRCAVRQFRSFDSARKTLSIDQVISLVVDIRHRADSPPTAAEPSNAIDLIAHLHAAWPSIPVIGYVDFSPQRARDILAAAHAGATEIILGDFDDLEMIANKIVDIGTSSDAATRVEMAIRKSVPPHLRGFFRFCILNARNAMTVENVVTRMHRSRKTLSNWLLAAHLPPPSAVIGWMRVLVAARLLEDRTRSTEKIARELHFMSGTALRNMLRRYVGCGPEALRQHGGFEYALQRFTETLAAHKKAKKRGKSVRLRGKHGVPAVQRKYDVRFA